MRTSRHRDRRVVITGMGVISAAGTGVPALWDVMIEPRSREALMPEFDRFDLRSSIYGPVPDFDPAAAGLAPDFVARNDRYACLGMAATQEALAQSGLLDFPFDNERVGVNLGTAIAGAGSMEQGFLAVTEKGFKPVDPRTAPPWTTPT